MRGLYAVMVHVIFLVLLHALSVRTKRRTKAFWLLNFQASGQLISLSRRPGL
jgi:hypothetical protein